MSLRGLGINVYAPVAGALCKLQGIGEKKLDGNSRAYFEVDTSWTDTHLFIDAKGYVPYSRHVSLPQDGQGKDIILADNGPVGPNIINFPPLVPQTPPVPVLGFSGRDILVDGKATKIVGIDGFLDYRYFLDGRDLTPFYNEARDLGFNCRRVWFEGAIEDNTVMQLDPRAPGFYDGVRRYIDQANAAGFIVMADIGVNNQYFNMGYDHWDKMNNLWRGAAVISSGGNEASKNGFDRKRVPNAQMPLWSSGSEQQNVLPEVSTGATVMLFHGVRQWPTSIRDAVASPTEIYDVLHFPDIPLLFDEMVKMGPGGSDRCDEPQVCYRFGRHWSAESAGVVFHNFRAQRGQLLNDQDKRCADGFVRGMRV